MSLVAFGKVSTPEAVHTISSTCSLTRSRASIQSKSFANSNLCDSVTKTPQHPTILITGANGRLGNFLRRSWMLWPDSPVKPLFAARRGEADIRLSDQATPQSELPDCETVVALWGLTSGSEAELAINSVLALASRDLALACGAKRVLHLSSAAVYGAGEAMQERRRPAPANAYGRAKLDMEAQVAQFADENLSHCCLRLANVVGADSLAPALAPSNDTPVKLDQFPDGRGPMRSYISPGHLARVLTSLAILPPDSLPEVLNVAAFDPVGMSDLAHAAGKDIHWSDAPATALQTVTMDVSRLASLLPDLSLRKSAEDMISDWQALRGGL